MRHVSRLHDQTQLGRRARRQRAAVRGTPAADGVLGHLHRRHSDFASLRRHCDTYIKTSCKMIYLVAVTFAENVLCLT